MYIEIVEVSEY